MNVYAKENQENDEWVSSGERKVGFIIVIALLFLSIFDGAFFWIAGVMAFFVSEADDDGVDGPPNPFME